jgi:hypothetical protein
MVYRIEVKESPSERIHQLVTLDSDLVVYPSLELSLASDGYSVLSSYYTYFDYRSLATKIFPDGLDRPRATLLPTATVPPYSQLLSLSHRHYASPSNFVQRPSELLHPSTCPASLAHLQVLHQSFQ